MKRLAPCCLLLTVACSPASNDEAPRVQTPATHTEFSIVADGEPSGLHFEGGGLTFCDKRGGRRLDLQTGRDAESARNCPDLQEANTACSGLPLHVAVRAPLSEPSDIVDIDGLSVPLDGRVHDCAADGKVLAIVTASAAVLIDTTKGASKEISSKGGDRVAIESKWVAWSKGSEVRVASRDAS